MEKKIIVAEDSLTIQKVFELTFSRTGFQVTYVDRGEELVALAKELNPSLVICDLTLPDLDGYETIRRLKEDPATAKIPALLVVGSLEPVDEEKYKACGADGLLQKPFESQELLDKVEELIVEVGKEEVEEVTSEQPADGWDFADVFEEVEMGVEGEAGSAPGMLDEMVMSESSTSAVDADEFAVGPDELSAEPEGEPEAAQFLSEIDEGRDVADLDDVLEEVPDDELEELDEIFEDEEGEMPVSTAEAQEFPPPEEEPVGVEEVVGEEITGEERADVTGEVEFAGDLAIEEKVRHVEDFPVSSGYDLKSQKVVREAFARQEARPSVKEISEAVESRIASPEFTEKLRYEVREIVEKVLWEVIPSVMEDLKGDITEVIREVAKEVVPEVADRIISEEIRKIREEITSGD